jgi:hypothetical protein
MPILTFAKSALGAVVDVRLLPSHAQLTAQAGVVATPADFKMLIDSGAEHTAVDESKIVPWNLYPATFYLSQTLGSRNTVQVYELAITILGQNGHFAWAIDALRVTARTNSPFTGLPYEGVIGRDVLDRGLFVYDGISSRCTIAY